MIWRFLLRRAMEQLGEITWDAMAVVGIVLLGVFVVGAILQRFDRRDDDCEDEPEESSKEI